ncbi:MAG: riboflavin biosynthesis protein RibF [Actinomycetota bacterium]|nr:riboflavin biosynthesis protein RibF [Actinomycetota bacterium]
MEVIRDHDSFNPGTKTVATIGAFDGIHVGHRRIIKKTIEAARAEGLPSLLMTFDVHPRQVLKPHEQVEMLTSLEDKLAMLAETDLDFVLVLNFRAIAKLSAADFCRQILIARANVAHLFVGTNFRFGAGAAGNAGWLKDHCAKDFSVTQVPLATRDETIVSSTVIRNLLKTGLVEKIPALMGRNITLSGRVVRGAGRGAGLGFPTANLEFTQGLCQPGSGVYTGYLSLRELRLPTVINCGTNPTFDGEGFHCEAHVLDYHADIYGSEVKLELTTRLRDEQKFPSPEALSRQITDDVHRAREWFEAQTARGKS